MAYTFERDEYGRPPHLTFETPQDFVQYIADLQAGKYPGIEADPQSIKQAQEITSNPGGWIMRGGHPAKKDDWLARNLPWIGPAAVGGAIVGPMLPGLLAGAGGGPAATTAASGALPTSTAMTNLGIQAGMAGAPTATASMLPGATSMGAGGWLGKLGKGALNVLGLGGDKGSGSTNFADTLIKLLVAGGSIKDLFGLGDDEEAEWSTFEGESRGDRSLDPRDLLAQGLGQAEGALGEAQARAKRPVQLRSAFAQQPPVFAGGGLPMPIGVTGVDPALKDPRLLSADLGEGGDEDDALTALNMLRG